MNLIDSHAHLTFEPLVESVQNVLERAAAVGVERVITIATDMADADRVIELARRDPRVHAAIGIHPHEAAKVRPPHWQRFERGLHDQTVVAFGEMGLDYHYDFADRTTQRSVFERQLQLAAAVDKPIIIHSREAHADTIAVLEHAGFQGRRVIFHCFTGGQDQADEISDHGWRISFTGVVTFKKSTDLQRIAHAYPIDRLIIETDAPFMSPEPVRNIRPNEPAHLIHTARFLADKRDMPLDAFAAQTAANTRAFFALPPADTSGENGASDQPGTS